MESVKLLEEDLKELRDTYNSGVTKTEPWRRSQLKALLNLLVEKEDEIFKALQQDVGKHRAEAYRDEIETIIKSVNYALKCLKQWMSSTKAKLPLAAFPSMAEMIPEPLGLVLVISSWNLPFGRKKRENRGVKLEGEIGSEEISQGQIIIMECQTACFTCKISSKCWHNLLMSDELKK